MLKKVPKTVIKVVRELEKEGFEAFVVGGAVRDLLLEKEPKDWDIATNAEPKEVLKIFPDGKYENAFGTVILPEKYLGKTDSIENIEVTTYRIESKYTDRRRPEKVIFSKTLKEDIERRDFTINAIALKVQSSKLKVKSKGKIDNRPDSELRATSYELIDLFGGQKDLKDKVIRAVGDPNERFNEDALRMMRAVRFASQLSTGKDLSFLKERTGIGKQNEIKRPGLWRIGDKAFAAIKKNKDLLKHISEERIRDELIKIILSERPAWGIELLVETGLMKYIIPEIYETIGVRQNRHHYHGPYNTVYKHMLASLKTCPSQKLEVRLAAFLHDIGKPKSKKGKGEFSTFHGHEYIGAKMAKKILTRLKFTKETVEKTVLLIKKHMFYYDVDKVGEKGVRKVIKKVGLENINDLIDVRVGDRLGSGVPKAIPYKLRHFRYMVEKVSKDPISVKQLKINGNDMIKELEIKPGPIIGDILDVLLAEVIDDPKLNTKKRLLRRAQELKDKNDLEKMDEVAKKKIEEKRKEDDKRVRGKYWVK
ncbi:MAG: HD domain-containing protein [Candidatus Moranbacteria bacterium]|nr:HD domain-containing protein [Candidatus Moranbacteria bacterium]